jgi:flagellar biogenesis protein FliO
MVPFLLAQSDPIPLSTGEWWQGLMALLIVAGLLGALVILARRGTLGGLMRGKSGPIAVETVLPLGDRRSLLIVSVEGRRLLLGASPVNVSLVAELGAPTAFGDVLGRATQRAEEPR